MSNTFPVWVDKANIAEFMDGYFGENERKNAAARRKAEVLLVGALALTAYSKVKKARRR